MSNCNMITIKSKLNGFTRTLGEPEFNGMIDKADYDIVDEKSTSSSPDDTWTNDQLREYMDSNNITYGSRDTKQELIDKIGT